MSPTPQHHPNNEDEDLKVLIRSVIREKKSDDGVPWWVKIFGGTILAVMTTVMIAVVQNVYSSINEANTQVRGCVTKEDFCEKNKAIWEVVKAIQEKNNTISLLQERTKNNEERIKKLEEELSKLRDHLIEIEKKKGAL